MWRRPRQKKSARVGTPIFTDIVGGGLSRRKNLDPKILSIFEKFDEELKKLRERNRQKLTEKIKKTK